MDDETCSHYPGALRDLRDWAWSRGRTDVVLDLDLHASAWAFQATPSRTNLVRLAAVLPSGKLAAPLEHDVRQLVAQGGDHSHLAAVQSGLRTWCTHLCLVIAADLSESEADLEGAEPEE